VVQDPLVGAEIVSSWAVIAPVLSAAPVARAHCPTTMAAAVPVWVVVNVVEEVRVTVTDEDVFVWGLVSSTVTCEPDTAVTWPDAAPKLPLPNVRPDGGRKLPPEGLVPPGAVPPEAPPNPPGRPPNPPRSQAPDTGWEIDTVVAVIGSPKGDDVFADEVGLPKAETHDPTVTADALVELICRIVVVDV
jgi:hypothetical protein